VAFLGRLWRLRAVGKALPWRVDQAFVLPRQASFFFNSFVKGIDMTSMEQFRAGYAGFLEMSADGPVSARAYYKHSGMNYGIEYWLLFLSDEASDNDALDVQLEPHEPMAGNVYIEDVVARPIRH
jgi:hypothetical protein